MYRIYVKAVRTEKFDSPVLEVKKHGFEITVLKIWYVFIPNRYIGTIQKTSILEKIPLKKYFADLKHPFHMN